MKSSMFYKVLSAFLDNKDAEIILLCLELYYFDGQFTKLEIVLN